MLLRAVCYALLCALCAAASDPNVFVSKYAKADTELTADPNSAFWKGVPGVMAENNIRGEPQPGHKTEIRSRWTDKNLYFLFLCPYRELYLKPDPTTEKETNKLWEWDVAEVFVGADFKNIHQYREYQVSPRGEWVDLDIDRKNPLPEGGWLWNSGFKVKARIDEKNKVWYGEMQIPIAGIDSRPPRAGNEMRINLFRLQGPPPKRTGVAWLPTHTNTHHTPEAFGKLVLGK